MGVFLQNIAKHQICHALPERSVQSTSLWLPKIMIILNTIPFTVISHLLWHICGIVPSPTLKIRKSDQLWREPPTDRPITSLGTEHTSVARTVDRIIDFRT